MIVNRVINAIWVAECFSCQYDFLEMIKNSVTLKDVKVFSSHSKNRPELKLVSDAYCIQPPIKDSADWLLEKCIENKVFLLFCGKNSFHIESIREKFEDNGICLITGSIGVENHIVIEDKARFTKICTDNGLNVVPAIKVQNVDELKQAIKLTKLEYQNICVKPVIGVFGFGFVKLDDNVSKFKHIEDPFVCNTTSFIESYAEETSPRPYLVMPYLENEECSVDISCCNGKIISNITRIKHGSYQECLVNGPCDDVAAKLVKLFNCDGLINIQFKKDHNNNWFILEINNRPSGGFAYSKHTGINLVSDLITSKLGIYRNSTTVTDKVWVRTATVSFPVEF